MAKIYSYNTRAFPVGVYIQTNDAQTSPPAGFLYCDGSAISRTVYSKLFAKIGTRYGTGDGSTAFNLPDTRGYFLRGFDAASVRTPNSASRFPNTPTGQGGNVIGSVQLDDNKAHTHSYQRALMTQPAGYSARWYVHSRSTSQTSQEGGSENRPKNIALNCFISFL